MSQVRLIYSSIRFSVDLKKGWSSVPYLIDQTIGKIGRHGQLHQTRHALSRQPAAEYAGTQRQRRVPAIVCICRRSRCPTAAGSGASDRRVIPPTAATRCRRRCGCSCRSGCRGGGWWHCTAVCYGGKCFKQTVVVEEHARAKAKAHMGLNISYKGKNSRMS